MFKKLRTRKKTIFCTIQMLVKKVLSRYLLLQKIYRTAEDFYESRYDEPLTKVPTFLNNQFLQIYWESKKTQNKGIKSINAPINILECVHNYLILVQIIFI